MSVETVEKKEDFLYNAYLLAGVIGYGAALILGLVSLPSVSKSLSWQEFRLIQVHTLNKPLTNGWMLEQPWLIYQCFIYANVSTLVKSYLIGPNVLLNRAHPQNSQHDEILSYLIILRKVSAQLRLL